MRGLGPWHDLRLTVVILKYMPSCRGLPPEAIEVYVNGNGAACEGRAADPRAKASGVNAPKRCAMMRSLSVYSLEVRTQLVLGRMPFWKLACVSGTASWCPAWEVTAIAIKSPKVSAGRSTRTGRRLAVARLVYGNEIRTTSPGCGIVPDLVVRVIPHTGHA